MYMPLLVRSQWRIVYIDFLGGFSKAESVAYKDTRTNKTRGFYEGGMGSRGVGGLQFILWIMLLRYRSVLYSTGVQPFPYLCLVHHYCT